MTVPHGSTTSRSPTAGSADTHTTDAAELTAQAIIDANRYMVLATADGTGRPWSSPVYFAHDSYAEFLRVSAPETTHSRNIAARPQVGVVIFDSHGPIGTGQGVYLSPDAPIGFQLSGVDLKFS
jgi:hypothetical protein